MQAEKTHFQLSERHKDRGVQKGKNIDAQAAAIILQSYIDSNK
jgi:RNase H-fold protein (predicted Holliday junction resolvase)